MPSDELKQYKVLYFDLKWDKLKTYFSEHNPRGAYRLVKYFLLNHGFAHVQYSGYHSKWLVTDLEVFRLIYAMKRQYPWLAQCVNRFEVTNVGENHDLVPLFRNIVSVIE